MKTLLIIRHAKAESSFTLNDFERPLNDRGKKDAPEMAMRLKTKNININAFISSPAARAKKTASLFYQTLGTTAADIIFISALYHAPESVFFETIKNIDNQFNTVAIFAHNPGITYFVNKLTTVKIDNMPTCAVFAISVAATEWKDFAKAKKELLFFDYPKK